jgi:hypothetical protein
MYHILHSVRYGDTLSGQISQDSSAGNDEYGYLATGFVGKVKKGKVIPVLN